jgi:hypothetical protein
VGGAYHRGMSTDEHDDPGADTAMFRAYVEDGDDRAQANAATGRLALIAVAVAVVVVLLAILLLS